MLLPASNIIKPGDLVIAYMTPENIAAITVKEGGEYHGRFARFRHSEMIGRPFGSKIKSTDGKRTICVLLPTSELWTRSLPHRTQILYAPDIAFITEMLEMRPGSVVVESGTGSGSFSHTIARTIAPSGHLHTFEFHEQRAAMALAEFTAHGLSPSIVTVTHRDVCKDGFGVECIADAVFLDLPSPWQAIPHAKAAFKRSQLCRICCFSPCIEQVQKTCDALREHGFIEIGMYECLLREHEVRKSETRDLVLSKPAGLADDAGNGCDAIVEDEKEDVRDEVRDEGKEEEDVALPVATGKRLRSEGKAARETATLVPLSPAMLVARPKSEMRGHTSYLTFATFLS